ncbi:MAG: hypothetical protein HC828_17895 [Blastochloris sp.]|nr:hypothetical protein [Blastochloris sp.]
MRYRLYVGLLGCGIVGMLTGCLTAGNRGAVPLTRDHVLGTWCGGTYRTVFSDGSVKGGPPPLPEGDCYIFRADGSYTHQLGTTAHTGTFLLQESAAAVHLVVTPTDASRVTQPATITIRESVLHLSYAVPDMRGASVEYQYQREPDRSP